ncbi:MAG: response regulator transcription factor [Tepidiformaceae bacterium]
MTEYPDTPKLRIIVAATYPSVRAGLRAMLDGVAGMSVVGELAAAAAESELHPDGADVLVADLDDDHGIEALGELARSMPVVLLGSEPGVFETLLSEEPRPRAYLLKGASGDEIAAAITAVAQGLVVIDPAVVRILTSPQSLLAPAGEPLPSPLTAREQDVLQLVATGLPNKGIALRLGISEHTVKFHVGAILGKLGAASRTEAVTIAVRGGLLPL